MSSEVYFIYVVSVNEGATEDFRELATELVAATSREAGTVSYHWSTNDGGRTVHMFEYYKDSAAVVSHVRQTFAPFAARLKSLARTTSVTVYGHPDAAARELMDEWGAVYMTPLAGFAVRSGPQTASSS